MCTQTVLFYTLPPQHHTHTQYKQNHLCVVWLGIAVAELCWAQPGHCWGLGCPVSTEEEREREHTQTHTHTDIHTQSLSVSTLSLASRQEAAGLNIWVPLMNWNLLGARIQWLNAIRLIFLGGLGVKRGLSSERARWRKTDTEREECAWLKVQPPCFPLPSTPPHLLGNNPV